MVNAERTLSIKRVRTVLQITMYILVCALVITAIITSKHIPAADAFAITDPTQVARNQAAGQLYTPTPTASRVPSVARSSQYPAAPQSVPGQPQVDPNTIVLYHFDLPADTVAIDATGRYTGTLSGNAAITNLGVYAGALRLDGATGYVTTGYLGTLNQGTIEAFVDFSEACHSPSDNFPIITILGPSGVVLALEENSGLHFGIYANGKWNWADSGINSCRYLKSGNSFNPPPWEDVPIRWPYEVWRFHHVAATWGPRGMEIWVDGVLHGVGNDDPYANIYPYPYMCNPQDQMMSSIYPLCKTPVMAPTMTVYPRGDYTGGLPTYNTFLIGYNPFIPAGTSSYPYFKGRIDEVRVSNIQRAFHWSVVPTITPTPTQTPVPISGEYSVDSQTIALFHLNYQAGQSVLEEVTQQYRYLSRYSQIVSNGRFGAALSLSGNDSSFDPGSLGNPGAGTLEAWVLFQSSASNQPLFASYQGGTSGTMFLGVPFYANTLSLGLYDGNAMQWQWVDSGVSPMSLAGCWHHVAGTWGARGMEIWIDGILQNRNGYTGGMLNPTWFWRVGGDLLGNSMSGLLDEVRVSAVQRTFTRQALAVGAPARAPMVIETPLYLPLVAVAPMPQCPFGP